MVETMCHLPELYCSKFRDIQLAEAASLSQTQVRALEARYLLVRKVPMFLILGIVLLLLWAGGFFVFHVAGFLIHILILLAIVSFVFQFLRGR